MYNIMGLCNRCKKGTAIKSDYTACSDKPAHAYCKIYDTDDGCNEYGCVNGYFVRDPSKSKLCEIVVSNCLEIDTTTGTCKKCVDGKILNNLKFRCLTSTIDGCVEYLSENYCSKCEIGRTLSDDL